MRKNRIKVIFGDKMKNFDIRDDEVHFSSEAGRTIVADKLLLTMGRVGNTEDLGLEELGIKINRRELIVVDEHFHTGVGKVYAVGDVIGFPSLASVSMDQGRLASQHAFEKEDMGMNALLPCPDNAFN